MLCLLNAIFLHTHVELPDFCTLILQFIMTLLEIRHIHDLHNQTRPAGEMLGALAITSLGVILLPGKACLLPRVVDGVDEVRSKAAIQLSGTVLLRSRLLRSVLIASISERISQSRLAFSYQ